jgi:hypothetical protein
MKPNGESVAYQTVMRDSLLVDLVCGAKLAVGQQVMISEQADLSTGTGDLIARSSLLRGNQ